MYILRLSRFLQNAHYDADDGVVPSMTWTPQQQKKVPSWNDDFAVAETWVGVWSTARWPLLLHYYWTGGSDALASPWAARVFCL